MKYLVEVFNKITNEWETRGTFANLKQISDRLFIEYYVLLDMMRLKSHALDDTYRISLITYKYDAPKEPDDMEL